MRGRGWLVRLSRILIGRRPVVFDIGGGTFIEGSLDDWMYLRMYTRGHERDAPFQHSLDLLPRDGVAFDIGAHVGGWSLLAVRHAPAAKVHAFEPVPERLDALRRHAQRNGAAGIIINPFAAGAAGGTVSFYAAHEGNTGASSLVRRSVSDVEFRVPVVALDSYVEQQQIAHVDLVKVDVEGAEFLVFSGAKVLLSAEEAPIIFFEADDRLSAMFGVSTRQVKQLLVDHGYGIYRWRNSGYMPVPVEEAHQDEDLFALKPQHMR
jgi:FkbM family methyltransferase